MNPADTLDTQVAATYPVPMSATPQPRLFRAGDVVEYGDGQSGVILYDQTQPDERVTVSRGRGEVNLPGRALYLVEAAR
jgi:hypothetical protein